MADLPCPNCLRLERELAALRAQVERLTVLLDEQRRAGKRQAAPFAKAPPKPHPKKPGRKPGDDYGTKAHRAVPDKIDEVHEAPLPACCPDCGGRIDETHVDHQYQVEIPRQAIHRQFNIHVGCCRQCRRRVQGRHPLQTSDALGAAASQLGPDAQAAVVELNKQAGLSHGKVSRVLDDLFGIDLTPGGSTHVILRAARRCEPVYATLRKELADADWVVPDETGWRIGGRPGWLHTMVGPRATVYTVDPTRSAKVAEDILGTDYSGIMIHDGWSPYDNFTHAVHQQCLAHLLRRCHEMAETATGGAVIFPRRVKDLLQSALELRDRRSQRSRSAGGGQPAPQRNGRVGDSDQDQRGQRTAGVAPVGTHRRAVGVSALAGAGRDELAGGAGDPVRGDSAKGLGRQPDRSGSAGARSADVGMADVLAAGGVGRGLAERPTARARSAAAATAMKSGRKASVSPSE
jgi:transposase